VYDMTAPLRVKKILRRLADLSAFKGISFPAVAPYSDATGREAGLKSKHNPQYQTRAYCALAVIDLLCD